MITYVIRCSKLCRRTIGYHSYLEPPVQLLLQPSLSSTEASVHIVYTLKAISHMCLSNFRHWLEQIFLFNHPQEMTLPLNDCQRLIKKPRILPNFILHWYIVQIIDQIEMKIVIRLQVDLSLRHKQNDCV